MFDEYELSENDALFFIQEAVYSPENASFKEKIIDPIITVLSNATFRNKYIEYGNMFIESNSEMLAKEYPTAVVSFPRKYVDGLLSLFGFTVTELTNILKSVLSSVDDKTDFKTIIKTPTNVIHTIALFYSDMIFHRKLRDAARQQLGLTIYNIMFNKYLHPYDEGIMGYTYLELNGSWSLVKAENMLTWINDMVDVSYGFFKTKLSVDMSVEMLVKFLNRTRTTFNQKMLQLAGRYFKNLNAGNSIGKNIEGDDEHVSTKNYIKIRENIVRMINNGDILYHNKDKIYPGISKLKNVKLDDLYNYSIKVNSKDLSKIIDNIFYVFLVKEGHTVQEINSTKYISMITNLPTAIDRAIQGKPIIVPLTKKYNTSAIIVKAHICFVATYIMHRIDQT